MFITLWATTGKVIINTSKIVYIQFFDQEFTVVIDDRFTLNVKNRANSGYNNLDIVSNLNFNL